MIETVKSIFRISLRLDQLKLARPGNFASVSLTSDRYMWQIVSQRRKNHKPPWQKKSHLQRKLSVLFVQTNGNPTVLIGYNSVKPKSRFQEIMLLFFHPEIRE